MIMFRLIVPIILIAVAAGVFVAFTNPFYQSVSALKSEASDYREALDNSKALENERDKLTQKFNSIDPASLDKLEKMLPENVDNIRLILEIEKIASPYGMVLREVKYDTTAEDAQAGEGVGSSAPEVQNREYGEWTLEFSTASTYNNFLNFLRDLERNLRIVDISSISFSAESGIPGPTSDVYRYSFKIKTYWLKN